jgi:hypothetical protein
MSSYSSSIKRQILLERKAIYEAWERSGLTKVNFCKQNKIAKRSFFKWEKQLRNNNYIDNDGDSILNTVNDIAGVDNGILETDQIKFLKISEVSESSFAPSQKNFGLKSNSSSSLEISLTNGTVIKAIVSQDYINSFLQEVIKWK